MNIALSFPGCHGRGGVERLLLESANYLAARGHAVHVYANAFDTAALNPAVIRHPVRIIPRPALARLASYTLRCRREFSRIETDVHGAFGVISPPGGVVNVQSVHRAWIEASQRIRGPGGRLRQACNPVHPFLLTLERHYFGERQYRKLIAPTEQVKADLIQFYNVPPQDIAIVENGFSARNLNATRSRQLRPGMRKELGYRPDDFVILFVANELERKGFGPLLRAIARLGNPKVHLLAVVGRARPETYHGEIRRLGLGGHVRFIPPKDDLAPYYAAADLFALPTQYEAWGLVIVEALACGTRVLTSRLAGAATAVCEGVTGELLENPLDINEIAAKLHHLLRCGAPNRTEISATVERFAWENVLKGYERILRNCAAAR